MPRADEQAFLTQVLKGDQYAIHFCNQIFQISQVVDDLIDQDKPVTSDQIIKAFWIAMIDLPENPFYRKHDITLRPIMATAFQDWVDSVQLERAGDDHGKYLAFVLRDQLAALLIQCARLVGGYEWMRQVSVAIRRHIHEDALPEYLMEFSLTNAVKHED